MRRMELTDPVEHPPALEVENRALEPVAAGGPIAHPQIYRHSRRMNGQLVRVGWLSGDGAHGAGHHQLLAAGLTVLRRQALDEKSNLGLQVRETHEVGNLVVLVTRQLHQLTARNPLANRLRGLKEGESVLLGHLILLHHRGSRATQRGCLGGSSSPQHQSQHESNDPSHSYPPSLTEGHCAQVTGEARPRGKHRIASYLLLGPCRTTGASPKPAALVLPCIPGGSTRNSLFLNEIPII